MSTTNLQPMTQTDVSLGPFVIPNPPLETMVKNTIQTRKVTCGDLSCNVAIALVGIALVVFAVIVWVHSVQEFGWINSKFPIYAVMGGVALTGTMVTIISLKWFVEACHRWKEFQKNASVLT